MFRPESKKFLRILERPSMFFNHGGQMPITFQSSQYLLRRQVLALTGTFRLYVTDGGDGPLFEAKNVQA